MTTKRKSDIKYTEEINKKYSVNEEKLKNLPKFQYKLDIPEDRKITQNIRSHQPTVGDTCKKQSLQYTGDKIIGLASMHKSNIVPIFSQTEAEDVAKMRR